MLFFERGFVAKAALVVKSRLQITTMNKPTTATGSATAFSLNFYSPKVAKRRKTLFKPFVELSSDSLFEVFEKFSKNRLNLSYSSHILLSEVLSMNINTKNLVSITEANQNFSKVARLVDENGAAVILKNNVPRYLIVEFEQAEKEQLVADEDVMSVSKRLLKKNRQAYETLAK